MHEIGSQTGEVLSLLPGLQGEGEAVKVWVVKETFFGSTYVSVFSSEDKADKYAEVAAKKSDRAIVEVEECLVDEKA